MSSNNNQVNDHGKKTPERPSSFGNSPVDVTPKDVSPENATWKDQTQRKLNAEDEDEKASAKVDEAGELSFPASDPPAVSNVTKIVKDKDGQLHPESSGRKNH